MKKRMNSRASGQKVMGKSWTSHEQVKTAKS